MSKDEKLIKKTIADTMDAYGIDGDTDSMILTMGESVIDATLKFGEHFSVTGRLVKGFEWEDSVDVGIFSTSTPDFTDTNIGAIANADVILYDPFSDYAKKNQVSSVVWLKKDIAKSLRALFGMESTDA
jgi:hypothetical protein